MPQGFPDYYEEKIIMTPLSFLAGDGYRGWAGLTLNAAAWPTANLAMFLPFILAEAVTIKRIFVVVSGTGGNIDVGIYDSDGKRLVSLGSTAMGAPGAAMSCDIADTLLPAGRYYLAVAIDNIIAVLYGASGIAGMNTVCGIREMLAAFPLPALATFA